MIDVAQLIVKRLPHLEAIELNCDKAELITMFEIFIDGLSRLSFVALSGCADIDSIYENKLLMCSLLIRFVRMEMSIANWKKNTFHLVIIQSNHQLLY